MLQIISGRFFAGHPVHEEEQDAVLYTNYSWIFPIQTEVGELRPTDRRPAGITAWTLRFTNRYERRPGDSRILAPADEAVDQFRLLCAFRLKALFDFDRTNLEVLCRQAPRSAHDTGLPRHYVKRFFDPVIHGTSSEADDLKEFIGKAISMPRESYRIVMSCLSVFFDALEALGSNFDLAYTLLVYALEALSETKSTYEPQWQDYDQEVREKLNDELRDIDDPKAERIKSILLQRSHLKLMTRFRSFVLEYLDDSFFGHEAAELDAMPRSRMDRVLTNLYASRSEFAHSLQKLQNQLKIQHALMSSNYFEWDNQPYLTFSGLVRLVHHVLSTYISRQPITTNESYPNWASELPGTIRLKTAPEYWIHNHASFTAEHATRYFNGLILYLTKMHNSTTKGIPDLSLVAKKIETLAPLSAQADRRPMMAIYWIFRFAVGDEQRRREMEEFLERMRKDIATCSIEMLTAYVVSGKQPTWTVEECEKQFDVYVKKRYGAKNTHLPARTEVAIIAELANMRLDRGDIAKYSEWVQRAIFDSAGRPGAQSYLTECQRANDRIEVEILFGLKPFPARLANGCDNAETSIRESPPEAQDPMPGDTRPEAL